MATGDLFLDDAELVKLTGRKLKSHQIAWLRREGLAFRVNATGHPVVLRSTVDQRAPVQAVQQGWKPRLVGT